MEIIDILKYEGDNTTFIWKHLCEDFNTQTQLIVHESQEAIFFMNGQALDLFEAGRYTLETENIPLLKKAINIPTDGKTPFHCEVYFINKTEQMAIKWGTDSKVDYIDPKYNFPLSIGASGEMSLNVTDSRKLLIKLVGTESILNQEKLISFFKGILMSKVKNYIAQTMKKEEINIFEVDARLDEFSLELKNKLSKDFENYGINLNQFVVTTILKPDGNKQYETFKELHFRQYADVMDANIRKKVSIIDSETEAEKVIIESKAIAQKRTQEGYTYQEERGFDVAQDAANNEATGQYTNAGIGLGMMSGVSGTIAEKVNTNVTNAFVGITPENNIKTFCTNCGNKFINDEKFCAKCGKER